jgi:hypothetical protein
MTINYVQLKEAMAAAGLPVSQGATWLGSDDGLYIQQYVPGVAYAAGVRPDRSNAHYGLAYAGAMPAALSAAVTGAQYSATLAGSPLTGVHSSAPVTWTLTEAHKPAGATVSYLWALGDGTNQTTSVPSVTRTYTAAGSFTATCTPTINGIPQTLVTAAAPAVLT